MFLPTSILFAFVFGAIIGSFLNVVIHRVPRGESVVFPGSKCPTCKNAIAWYDNIPIVSWFVLGGQCRHCKAPFSGRYAAVEALVGALSAFLWAKLVVPMLTNVSHWSMLDFKQLLVPFFLYFTFLCLCVSIAFIDLEHFIIPHSLSIPGILIGLASPWIIGAIFQAREVMQLWPPITPMLSLTGAIVGALSIIAIFLIYLFLRGVPGMGGGDVTLMAMMGAWLGWPALLFIFFAASVQGLIAAGLSMALGWNFVKDASEVLDEEQEESAQHEPGATEQEDDPASQQDVKEVTPTAEEHLTDPGENAHAEDTQKGAKEEDEEEPEGLGAAIPFGPFIVLAGLEHFFFGPFLPDTVSMIYMYLY